VEGDIDVNGILRIDGDVRGTVRVTGKIIVGAAGRIDAPIRAKSAIIGGKVKGDVYVSERLRVLSGGVVIGNVFAPLFEADDGTIVHGDMAVTGRLEGADDELDAFVRSHGDAHRFLGRFREDGFAGPVGLEAGGKSASPAPQESSADLFVQALAPNLSETAIPPAEKSGT
jgi:cytoskeletal protein CcmA (bactofilin family)